MARGPPIGRRGRLIERTAVSVIGRPHDDGQSTRALQPCGSMALARFTPYGTEAIYLSRVWLAAIAVFCSEVKGTSDLALPRDLGCLQVGFRRAT